MMDTVYWAFLTSVGSLLVALFALWLNYKNRLSQQRLEKQLAAETALSLLNRCDVLIENADAFFREFWRIALNEALLKAADFERITNKISEQRSIVTGLRQNLVESAEDDTAIQKVLKMARQIEAGMDPLQTSLGHGLAALKREVDLAQTLSEPDRHEKLRTAIAHIKQWKSF